jgi:hypothetical protein
MGMTFSNSTLVIGSSTKSSTQSLDFPLTVVNGIAGREERGNLHTTVKENLE